MITKHAYISYLKLGNYYYNIIIYKLLYRKEYILWFSICQ